LFGNALALEEIDRVAGLLLRLECSIGSARPHHRGRSWLLDDRRSEVRLDRSRVNGHTGAQRMERAADWPGEPWVSPDRFRPNVR